MAASPGSNPRREWAAQIAWAASGVVLALIVFELLDLRGDEVRRSELIEAARAGDAKLVRELVAEGTPPGVTTPEGWTPLHFAALYGHENVVALLLQQGAAADARHSRGWTPLHRAAEHGSIEIARMLIERGAPVDAQANGRSALTVALSKRHHALAGYLVDQGARMQLLEERSQLTPVLYAAMSGDAVLLAKMLDRGAAIDDRLRNGASALHLAVGVGSRDAVSLLLARGADPNVANVSGSTPLHQAARTGSRELAALLVEAGAGPGLANASGQRAAAVARENGHDAVAAFLEPSLD